MSKSDGSVIIATIIDTEGIEKGTVQIKKELIGVGDDAEKANKSVGTQLAGGFKKLGKAIVAAGVVDMLVDFGKEAIELGSDLEEVQNVVDVTFETMSDSVNQFAKDAQKSAGLSEKMAKQYVGTFGAMADSFGFTEQEAYEMSTALTQLTGDVASFYNLSQDEAMNKLKGVFTGETEALKELGVVMTQTALDSYAMANGFGKTTSAMSEQEKVALRYQFVMDQLSAASGDFVRTQDSWANQSKVLSLQWESLMATIGSGMIDALMPGMQFLNDTVMPLLQDVAEGFAKAFEPTPTKELSRSLKSATKAVKAAKEQYAETAAVVEENAVLAGIYKDRLYELEAAGLTTGESQIAYASIVEQLNALYPELNLKISEQTGLIDDNSRAALANVEAMKQKYLMMAVEEQLTSTYQAQASAQLAVNQALAEKEAINANLILAEQQLAESLNLTVEEMYAIYGAAAISAGAISDVNGNEIALTGTQMTLISTMNSSRQEMESLDATIEEGQAIVAEYDAEIQQTTSDLGTYSDTTQTAAEGQNTMSEATVNTSEKIAELRKEYDEAVVNARKSIDSQIGLFDKLELNHDKSTADILANWESQRVALDAYSDNIQKAIDMGLDEALVKQLSDGSTESMAILDAMVNDTDLNVDEINTAFRKTEQSRDTVAETMAGVQTDLAGKFSEIYQTVDSAWGDISYSTQLAIDDIARTINRLQGKTVYVDTIHRTYYKTYGSSGGSSSSSSSVMASGAVPYLAKGAVIPPNAPFMAVLGDQRHGTNVEAPLSTIQEAVALVMQDQMDGMLKGFEALLQESRELRSTVENITVGDDVLGRAVDRYNLRNAVMQGG